MKPWQRGFSEIMQSLTSSSSMTSCFSDTILRNSSWSDGYKDWLQVLHRGHTQMLESYPFGFCLVVKPQNVCFQLPDYLLLLIYCSSKHGTL